MSIIKVDYGTISGGGGTEPTIIAVNAYHAHENAYIYITAGKVIDYFPAWQATQSSSGSNYGSVFNFTKTFTIDNNSYSVKLNNNSTAGSKHVDCTLTDYNGNTYASIGHNVIRSGSNLSYAWNETWVFLLQEE